MIVSRRAGRALLVDASGKTVLKDLHPESIRELRIRRGGSVEPRDEHRDDNLAEKWLRDLIFRNPQVLPVTQIEREFAPLVPLATEIEQIDALFVSPGGFPTIVETKLTTNPESRREVLAQVIDYARALSRLGVEDLAAAVGRWASGRDNEFQLARDRLPKSAGLYEFVASYTKANYSGNGDMGEILASEEAFLETLKRNLERARFLLLVVGDRDLLRVQDLAEDLQHSFAFMHFTLAIVELNMYEFDLQSFLIVPRVLVRTKEIRRTVGRIEGLTARVSFPDAAQALEPESSDRQGRRKLTDDDFFAQLAANGHGAEVPAVRELIDYFRKPLGLVIEPKSSSQSVRYVGPITSGKQPISLLYLDTSYGANFGYLWSKIHEFNLPEEIAVRAWERVSHEYGTGMRERTAGTKHVTDPSPPNPVPYKMIAAKPEVLKNIVSEIVEQIREAQGLVEESMNSEDQEAEAEE